MENKLSIIVSCVTITIWVSTFFGVTREKCFSKINIFRTRHSEKYKNNLYKEASKNNKDRFVIMVYIILFAWTALISEFAILSTCDLFFGPEATSITVIDTTIADKIVPWFIIFLIVVFNFLLLLSFIRQSTIVTLITEFKYHLTIIRPLIEDEKEYNLIKQEWALMETKDDYEQNVFPLLNKYLTQIPRYKSEKKK